MNPGTAVFVNLLGGVALLLWGVRMVRTGVTRAYGDRLKNFIEHRVGNRVSAFMAGGVATAILGSGTAMALIVVGLAAAGAINTALGLAVLLGADVGSAIVSSVFASGSNLALWASPLLIFAGYIVHSWSAELRPHNLGRALIGLGLMLLSLTLIKQASAPLSTASLFHELLAAVGKEPVLAFLIGAVLTWIFHSSLAVILLIASFLASGSLAIDGALAFILGINLGGGLPAVSATLAQPPVARRWPISPAAASWRSLASPSSAASRHGCRCCPSALSKPLSPSMPGSTFLSACSSCRSRPSLPGSWRASCPSPPASMTASPTRATSTPRPPARLPWRLPTCCSKPCA